MYSTSTVSKSPFPLDRAHVDKNMGFNPHAYTSGRWLRHNRLERASRHVEFNFKALCQRVIELSSGASAITNCHKLEGSFNRVFIFELNNSKRIVARLPFKLAGLSQLTTVQRPRQSNICKAKLLFLYPKSLTGLVMPRVPTILLAANISSWSIPPVFNCTRSGQKSLVINASGA